MNAWEKRITKIMQKPENKRTCAEAYKFIDYRYNKKQKIFYEEFFLVLLTYDSAYFCYHGLVYEIDSCLSDRTTLFIVEYDNNNNEISRRSENYTSIIELLNNARIDGKTIKDIWDDVTL